MTILRYNSKMYAWQKYNNVHYEKKKMEMNETMDSQFLSETSSVQKDEGKFYFPPTQRVQEFFQIKKLYLLTR